MSAPPERGPGRNIAGAEYVQALTARESDRRARAAFQARALGLAPAGARIYDFGAGPGLDARHYALAGRRVEAYDIDPTMCEYFAGYCADLIERGVVVLHAPDYGAFLGAAPRAPQAAADLVTANFAPLNLVTDLGALFAALAALLRPGGRMLASVLNPYYAGDLRYGWFWRNLPRFLASGRFAVPGAQALIWRRSLAVYAACAAPYFVLERVHRDDPDDAGGGLDPHAPGARWRLTGSRFMFLQLRRL